MGETKLSDVYRLLQEIRKGMRNDEENYRAVFEVSGVGQFPIHMLSSEQCYPSDFSSVRAIQDPTGGIGSSFPEQLVTLARDRVPASWRPAENEWAALGWRVGSIAVMRIAEVADSEIDEWC